MDFNEFSATLDTYPYLRVTATPISKLNLQS